MYTIDTFADANLEEVLEQLTVDEKLSLLAGATWWDTVAIPRIGVPSIRCSDGPNGVRGSSHFRPTKANCIPCETALGATFDRSLIHRVGGLLARDAKAKGSSLLLAPTCNIQRNPLNGRAFESFSEDPYLNGHLAAAYVNGLQEEGVGAVIKHFVCNDQEHERFSSSSEVPERARREIYLTPFMIAQKYAKPWSYMTSYNRVNGLHCSEDKQLLQGLLRDEWGFDGLVMSDWFGCYSGLEALEAGLDLEMPGPTRFRGESTGLLINSGKLDDSVIDARARAVLQAVQRGIKADIDTVRAANAGEPERPRDTPEDRALNREVAANAIVLLKNTAGVLPLKTKEIKTVAVVGPNAKTRSVSGGGSAYLTASYTITPLEGITRALEGTGIEVKYTPGAYGHRELPMLDGWVVTEDGENGMSASFYNDDPFEKDAECVETLTLPSTRIRINDSKPKGLGDQFYVSCVGYVTAEETGPFEFGMSTVGRARLLVDGKLVIDNGFEKKQTAGATFYGLGTIEEKGTYDFKAGQKYKIEVQYTNVAMAGMSAVIKRKKGQPTLMMAACRIGGAPQIADETAAIKEAAKLAEESDVVLCFTGADMGWESEGSDRTQFMLPGKTNELVEALLAVKPETVIVNQSGSAYAMPWVNKATTILQSWFGGNETGAAIADVLTGKVNPSGRMPLSFPHQMEDCTAFLNWQAENGKVYYGEGLFVGYRGYEATKRDTMFAFGQGESYTTFEWSGLSASIDNTSSGSELAGTAKVTVKNTGKLAGAEVVQIYVSDKESSLRRPHKELKGFGKVFLQPGESKEVEIALDKLAFSFYDDAQDCWVAEEGEFEIIASRSCVNKDIAATISVTLEKTLTWRGV